MTLIKTSILTSFSTIIKLISGFVINKVMAIYVGPTGIALVGQLQNFTSIITVLSNGATTSGIVKYTAEYQNINEKRKIFSSSIAISIICSLLISILLFLFSKDLSLMILNDPKYFNVFTVFGATVVLFALNTVLMSILNGQKEIIKYVIANICTSIFSLILTCVLIVNFNLIGVLYSIVLNQSLVFFVTLLFVIKSSWFKFEYFVKGLDKVSLIKLSKFSLMAISSVISLSASQIILRNYIGDNLSWNDAGYWQGINYLSTMYLTIITTSLSVYFLPKISELKNKIDLKNEILYSLKIIIPFISILLFIVFLLKDLVIVLVFTKEFLLMRELFLWQLIGDVFKVISFIPAYYLLAKSKVFNYTFIQLFFPLFFTLFSMLLINYFNLVGVTISYMVTYFLCSLYAMYYVFKDINDSEA